MAQNECATDADCPLGLSCVELEAPVDAAPPCDPDTDCNPDALVDAGAGGGSMMLCQFVPVSCASATDCAEGLTCFTVTIEECSGGGTVDCADGDPDCVPMEPTEPDCTSTEQGYCVPPYVPPCEVDADCGEGFDCVEAQACACNGGGGTDVGDPVDPAAQDAGSAEPSSGADGGSAEPAPDVDGGSAAPVIDVDGGTDVLPPDGDAGAPDCTCEPTGERMCEVRDLPCLIDDDCPAGLVCGNDAPVACTVDPDGGTSCEEPDPADMRCMIPGGLGGGGDVLIGENTGDGDSDPQDPVVGDGDGDGDTGATGDGDGDGDGDTGATGDGDGDGDDDDDEGTSCASERGTSRSVPVAGSFALLLAGAFLGRRRARR